MAKNEPLVGEDAEKPFKSLYQKNLFTLSRIAKKLFIEFNRYKPQKIFLYKESDGRLNLWHQPTKTQIYPNDAKTDSLAQVQHFIANPNHLDKFIVHNKHCFFEQDKCIQKINQHYENDLKHFHGALDKPVGIFFMNGCGLGFHLNELIEKISINNLFLFEANKDIFYAFLHTIDLDLLINTIKAKTIHLYVGCDKAFNFERSRDFIMYLGFYNIANGFIYEHMQNDQFELLKSNKYKLTTGHGFLEDEKISLSHTIINIKNNIPILNNALDNQDLPAAFIVGNGPSLDGLIDTIKAFKENVIIISSGSTIGSLFKAGIKPDIHVEVERTSVTVNALNEGSTEAFRKDVILLTSNTVHPGVMSCFKEKYMALRVCDTGSELIEYLHPKKYLRLPSTNTVVNTSLNLALRLGFKKIYFIGVDMGMLSNARHHAQLSPYYDKSKKFFQSVQITQSEIEVKGNFRPKVITNDFLNLSRQTLGDNIKDYPDVQVFNLSDGAFIENAIPLRPDDLTNDCLNEPIKNKKTLLRQLLKSNANTYKGKVALRPKRLLSNELSDALDFLDMLKFTPKPTSIDALFDLIDSYNKVLVDLFKSKNIAYHLVSGSFQTMTKILLSVCLNAKDSADFEARFNTVSALILDFFKECQRVLTDELLVENTFIL